MEYNKLSEDKLNDLRPTTITTNCTKSLKYRCMVAAQERGLKIDQWCIEAFEEKLNGGSAITINDIDIEK